MPTSVRDPLDNFDDEDYLPEDQEQDTASTIASTLTGDLTLSTDDDSGLSRDEEIVLANLIQSKPGGLASLNKKTRGLHKLCQTNTLFFGEVNTPRRRKFQNKVDRWKKLSRAEYIVELEDLGVSLNPPAPVPFRKAAAAKKKAVPATVSAPKKKTPQPPPPVTTTRPLAFSPITKMSAKKKAFVTIPAHASKSRYVCCCCVISTKLASHTGLCYHPERLTIDLELPEKHSPIMVFPFMQAPINDGKDVADGFDIEIWDAHIMDIVNDRFKLEVAGANRKELLLEMPRVTHRYLNHFNSYAAKLQTSKEMFYEEIFKQHILARNELLSDPDRHQQWIALSIPDGGIISCEHFPYERDTDGDEVDYDVVPYVTDDSNGNKVYRNTNATVSWKIIFEDTVRSAKRTKARGKRGKSKLDGIDEGMDNLNVHDEF